MNEATDQPIATKTLTDAEWQRLYQKDRDSKCRELARPILRDMVSRRTMFQACQNAADWVKDQAVVDFAKLNGLLEISGKQIEKLHVLCEQQTKGLTLAIEALVKYGSHSEDCERAPCSCGLDEIILHFEQYMKDEPK